MLAAALLVAPATASAQEPDTDGTGFYVTMAARSCPTYESITANRARNDIQESLRDLGKDTLYTDGEPINPTTEDQGQPTCRPITDWQFTLGRGYLSRAVAGPWGQLSIVTEPFTTPITTLASTPLLDDQGRPVAGQAVPGAVSIELSPDQAELSQRANTLWIQGGTPTDPILDAVPQFEGRYGFGALRCAIDNLNGDNVEWIGYPQGVRHVFCYAYYVEPPPTSGTIVIRKESTADAAETFSYRSDLTYDPSGRFSLSASAGQSDQETFYRAAGLRPWTVTEEVPAGWELTELTCTNTGSSTISYSGATASIVLAAGDLVTCTYKNRPKPPPGQLSVRKVTVGGVGTFGFDVHPAAGGSLIERLTAKTRLPFVPVTASPSPLSLEAGRYRIDEDLPASSARGSWSVRAVACNGRLRPANRRQIVEVTAGEGATCTYLNRFTPAGSIEISKVTRGNTGTAGFQISSLDDPARQYQQTAEVTQEGTPTRARGDDTSRLPLGRYVIQETNASPDTGDGRWVLGGVVCGDVITPWEHGRVEITLTRKRPDLECRFYNVYLPRDVPPEPPGPNPVPGGPRADLQITKVPDQPTATSGQVVGERITVTNRGPVAAEQVVVGDQLVSRRSVLVSAEPSQGRCYRLPVLACDLGELSAGASATVRLRVQVFGPGSEGNVAVVGSSTLDRNVRSQRVRAAIDVRRRARPQPCEPRGRGARSEPSARAAC